MFKKKLKFSVTRKGKPLSKRLYTWNEHTRTFSTDQHYLVLDFRGINGVTFNTRSYCTFITGNDCKFTTRNSCTFTTGSRCIFYTRSYCMFNTLHDCKFRTGFNCIFKTGSNCMFDTGSRCIIIRYDVFAVFETIKLEKKSNHIKLNEYFIPGYTEVLPTDLYTWE